MHELFKEYIIFLKIGEGVITLVICRLSLMYQCFNFLNGARWEFVPSQLFIEKSRYTRLFKFFQKYSSSIIPRWKKRCVYIFEDFERICKILWRVGNISVWVKIEIDLCRKLTWSIFHKELMMIQKRQRWLLMKSSWSDTKSMARIWFLWKN